MASFNPSSRYNSFDNRSSTQSNHSDPSSSTELKQTRSNYKNPVAGTAKNSRQSPAFSSALVKTKNLKNEQNLAAMVKKFMEKRSGGSGTSKQQKGANFVVAADFIAEDLKKTARKGTGFGGLHKKLFGKGSSGSGSSGSRKGESSEGKALVEVKSNTRTLAMVLRSERELLSANKEQEEKIVELNLVIEEKNREVEKLKDLCLKQREEIKALKSAILFPDVMNLQLQGLLDKQDSELKQAKQLIPSLQKQVTSLSDQLQCLAEDLAEVKADKYSITGCYEDLSSPRTPPFEQQDAANSLEFSSEDHTTPGSPDDMFLKDLNPCLTPYYATNKSKEFECYDSPVLENKNHSSHDNIRMRREIGFGSQDKKVSKSSTECQYINSSGTGTISARPTCRSDESKCTYGKRMH